ncbi:hypothetical protein GCM10025771_20140 [Niveibacterium umoris]|uniref:Uncharacterized protein n=1 Tax=Niveibacterium umoris TaxID=1193620 RepID=A0A840BQV6_9RHOO|nr:hypothetical protein [Niveibacterium umoris]MBB4012797.1 hypothetical protein [Niveibacterium umoris]
MHAPMYLPWLARKAGISDTQALEYWHEALRHATESTGWVGGSDYWAAAHDRLLELTDAARRRHSTPHIVRMVRTQHHLAQLPLQAFEDLLGGLRASFQRPA